MNFFDALAKVEAGLAGDEIERFITKALFDALQAETKNERSQEIDDAFIAAIALQMLEKIPEARYLIGKGRRARGDAFDVAELFNSQPTLDDAVGQYLSGKLQRSSLLDRFYVAIEDQFGKVPDIKTAERVMQKYIRRYALAHRQVGIFEDLAEGSQQTAADIFHRFIGRPETGK